MSRCAPNKHLPARSRQHPAIHTHMHKAQAEKEAISRSSSLPGCDSAAEQSGVWVVAAGCLTDTRVLFTDGVAVAGQPPPACVSLPAGRPCRHLAVARLEPTSCGAGCEVLRHQDCGTGRAPDRLCRRQLCPHDHAKLCNQRCGAGCVLVSKRQWSSIAALHIPCMFVHHNTVSVAGAGQMRAASDCHARRRPVVHTCLLAVSTMYPVVTPTFHLACMLCVLPLCLCLPQGWCMPTSHTQKSWAWPACLMQSTTWRQWSALVQCQAHASACWPAQTLCAARFTSCQSQHTCRWVG